jgi:hypothetical protein
MKGKKMKKSQVKPIIPTDLPADVAIKAFNKGLANSNLGIQIIYGVRDMNLGFSSIFIGKNDGIVCRDVMGAIKSAKENHQPSPIADFPDNFSIWEIAQINEDTKTLSGSMRKVIEVKDLIAMYE